MYELYNNLFDDFFSSDSHSRVFNLLRTDIKEDDDKYLLSVDIPGVKKEDIKLSYSDNYLKISFKIKENNDEENKDKVKFIKKERYVGSYSRSYFIPNIDANSINASYNDGVLNVELYKNVVNSVKSIEIK